MLPGVYLAYKKNKTAYYRASITYRNKHISLGSYELETTAHQAYLQALDILSGAGITLSGLDTESGPLLFEKKIALLNFRNNHIYFKNPIYLKQNYFLYFISPHDELKFDADDLFYYSSHKIMRRKGHLFVCDYGMQVNILSRYGIRNFAVAGRDYRFVNGDPSDFRYSNLEVINPYYGVMRILRQNTVQFKAQIHIAGNHVIGLYPTQEEAAVAYNKAVDTARYYGIQKNYFTNYIQELSPQEYARLYAKSSISAKLIAYLKDQAH
ncbi:MAG: hypothetical protein HFI76_02710 [Lachnospiraceae bacterium]|jgi:hypothetical protein|nr:hypothetical protein [Lachnospiraceae bacterium]